MNSAKLLGLSVEKDASYEVAKRSRGTPRVANRLLRRIRDYAQVKEATQIISQEIVDRALDSLGIDKAGLDDVDRKLLRTILDSYEGGPVGVESLAATLNEEVDTIVDCVEPFLLKTGFLKRTPRGRQATELAYEHLGIKNKKDPQKKLF